MDNPIQSGQERIEAPAWCVFRAGSKEFVLPIEAVREVLELSPVFRLPLAPDYIYGIVPLRGRVIPAIDLSKIYSTGSLEYETSKLIVADAENEHIGFISETMPFFVPAHASLESAIRIDIKSFFETFRVKEPSYAAL